MMRMFVLRLITNITYLCLFMYWLIEDIENLLKIWKKVLMTCQFFFVFFCFCFLDTSSRQIDN